MSTPEPFWQRAWDEAQPALEQARDTLASLPSGVPRPVRVGQLDAELLDQELVSLLKQPITTSLKLAKPEWAAKYDLELSFLIQLLLYKSSVWKTGATYGAKLQDLQFERPQQVAGCKYAPSGLARRVLVLHVFATIVVPYIHARIRAHALSRSWPDIPRSDIRRKIWEALVTYETFQSTFSLLGFLSFLWNGRYRSIVDRMLGLRLVPARRVVARNVNYEFMNRQMVWHAFTEFLLFVLPLINVRSVRKRLRRSAAQLSDVVTGITQRVAGTYDYASSTTSSKQPLKRGRYADFAPDSCAICAEDAELKEIAAGSMGLHLDPSMPAHPINVAYRTSCGHDYCYACLTDRMLRASDEGEQGWECLRCRALVFSSQRVEEKNVADDIYSDILSDGEIEGMDSSDYRDVFSSASRVRSSMQK